MADSSQPETPAAPEIDLKNPSQAALLAWLVPGAGHFYQGRRGKAWLYFVCVTSTFFFGMYLGGPHTVYAQRNPDFRWHYICQAGAGVCALPAMVQSMRRSDVPRVTDWYAPPNIEKASDVTDEFDRTLLAHPNYEMGTVYTMVAGLLNLLAIFDAYAGPVTRQKKPPAELAPGGS